jgi:hypothetical protein
MGSNGEKSRPPVALAPALALRLLVTPHVELFGRGLHGDARSGAVQQRLGAEDVDGAAWAGDAAVLAGRVDGQDLEAVQTRARCRRSDRRTSVYAAALWRTVWRANGVTLAPPSMIVKDAAIRVEIAKIYTVVNAQPNELLAPVHCWCTEGSNLVENLCSGDDRFISK